MPIQRPSRRVAGAGVASSGERGWMPLQDPRGRHDGYGAAGVRIRRRRTGRQRRCRADHALAAHAGLLRRAVRPACASDQPVYRAAAGARCRGRPRRGDVPCGLPEAARYDAAQADARPWLYGIATRLIGRHRRDEVRFFRAITRTGVDPAAEPVADQVTDRVAAQAASRELAAAVAALSRAQRDVLLLVASGLSYQEAGLALGVPAGTVSSRLARARRKVREALGGQDPTRPGRDSLE